MNLTQTALLISGSAIAFALGILAMLFSGTSSPEYAFAGQGGVNANACEIVSTSTVAIGNEESTQVLASDARRAWAVIEQPTAATNTVSISLGSDAVDGQGFGLAPGGASTTPDKLQIGLNTDFPYTGSVEAITSTGSTSVRVIDCRY